jgi:hypothetical protein
MSRDVVRVVIAAVASLAMIVAATLFLEWFIVDFANVGDIAKVTFDLREARACTHLGPCAVVPMSMIKGSFYPALASVTLWAGLVFAALVLYQCGTRVLTGGASDAVGRIAHLIGVIVMMTSVGAGYVFGPDFETGAMMGFGVTRGWGPLLMLAGLVAGHAAVWFSREGSGLDDTPAFRQVDLPPAQARTRTPYRPISTRVPLPTTTPPHGQPTVARPATVPPVSRTPTPSQRVPTIPPHPSTGITALADVWRGKVKFAVLTGELSIAGIDARREDGGSVLVMWRDVVGLVARRLPGDLGSHPFVDIVSTAGMTLRILPWSRMTGEVISGEPETRVRTFMKLVAPRCPEAKLDRATQAFLDDDAKSPAQLPNLDMLAKHDTALA